MADASTGGIPVRLHHYGSVVRDQAKVREFMEDVLGFPLVATWAERSLIREVGETHDFCHTFYALGDGSALAFFQFADPAMFDRCRPKTPADVQRFDHIAFKVDGSRYDDLKRRLETAKAPLREIDHGYCRSLYTKMEDGLELEFTVDPVDVDQIAGRQSAAARQTLAAWLGGDHRPNNNIRHAAPPAPE